MIYVMSDIHGEFSLFMQMLEKINFNENDTLYILGDIVDRGNENVEMIHYVMGHDNVIMLLGNHEYMMLEYYTYKSGRTRNIWYNNGGYKTHNELLQLSDEEQEQIMDFFKNLSYKLNVEVNGQIFELVHGSNGFNNVEDTVWERMPFEKECDNIVIFGHTPTCHYQDNEPYAIYHNGNIIGIDCGVIDRQDGVLGCLCLDNMNEFYVERSIKNQK